VRAEWIYGLTLNEWMSEWVSERDLVVDFLDEGVGRTINTGQQKWKIERTKKWKNKFCECLDFLGEWMDEQMNE
jgi:hypothetical protein